MSKARAASTSQTPDPKITPKTRPRIGEATGGQGRTSSAD